jgi:hypothetical protein
VHLKDLISHPHEKPPRKKREKGREGKGRRSYSFTKLLPSTRPAAP